MEYERKSSPIPAHLDEVKSPQQTAWEGFFKGFMQTARRRNVSPRDLSLCISFPYEEPYELSLLTIQAKSYKNNPLNYIHGLYINVLRGRRWAATASAKGILLDNSLHLLESFCFSNANGGFTEEDIYPIIHHVGGLLEQPEEYQIFPRP